MKAVVGIDVGGSTTKIVGFDIRNIYRDIKLLYDGRALIRDSDDNRYEIPDIKKLDAKSMSLLALDT